MFLVNEKTLVTANGKLKIIFKNPIKVVNVNGNINPEACNGYLEYIDSQEFKTELDELDIEEDGSIAIYIAFDRDFEDTGIIFFEKNEFSFEGDTTQIISDITEKGRRRIDFYIRGKKSYYKEHRKEKNRSSEISRFKKNQEEYRSHFTIEEFKNTTVKYGTRLGRETIEKIFYLVASIPFVPKNTKYMIMAALGYLILPMDLCSDLIPFLGLTDDIMIITYVMMRIDRTNTNKLKDSFEKRKEKAQKRTSEIWGK